jgi:hypothetical protein
MSAVSFCGFSPFPWFLALIPDSSGHRYFSEELESVRKTLLIPERGIPHILLHPMKKVLKFFFLMCLLESHLECAMSWTMGDLFLIGLPLCELLYVQFAYSNQLSRWMLWRVHLPICGLLSDKQLKDPDPKSLLLRCVNMSFKIFL